ncbi:hypothetical protein C1N73_33265 (plasmid) [Priestia aryabhattai]
MIKQSKKVTELLGVHRTVSLDEVFDFLLKRENLDKIGITRLAVTHGLDRIGIPTASATVPSSLDSISIYSGKGTTAKGSKISAIMEAVERVSATSWTETVYLYSEKDLENRKAKFCSPSLFTETRIDNYSSDKNIEWVKGFDLVNEEELLVPLGAVINPYIKKSKSEEVFQVFKYTHTNGLASGFSLEEAIPQALCEVIERDAVSLAELRSSIFPFAFVKQLECNIKETFNSEYEIDNALFSDDFNLYKSVEIETLPDVLKNLIGRFFNANINISLKYITNDIEIPTFGCCCLETLPSGKTMFRAGYGTHPDKETALIRAVTELAQSRIVDIQGAREDVHNLDKRRFEQKKIGKHWLLEPSTETISFQDIPSKSFFDLSEEIHYIVEAIQKVGFKTVIVIPISSVLPNTYVVRVLIPGIETWHPTAGNSLLGHRAKKLANDCGIVVDEIQSYI